jgi:hypothetical protein
MKIAINGIHNDGDQSQEFVELKVTESTNLKYYLISDTTYIDETTVSNKLPHTYWFSSIEVAKDDFVRLHTKSGAYKMHANTAKTTTHNVYWGLDVPVWNDTGDKAMLFEVSAWTSKKAK